jgi:predicted amidohydrolase YtcJ
VPDIIFHNGTILTMNPASPRASALAVRNGRILAVDDEDEVLASREKHTTVVNLQGRCLTPGIHDSHVHLTQHGLALSRLDLHEAPTLAAGLEHIAERAAELPAGSWILGSGFSTSRWGVRSLTKEQLDRAAPHHPALLTSQDMHSAWANSLALEQAGIHAGTPDPENGTLVRDERGAPSGLLLEHATALVRRVVPEPSDTELLEASRRAGEDFARLGITTVHHMAAEPAAYWRQLALAASRDDFPLRVWACIPHEDAEHATAVGLATGQGGARFTVGGAKFFADGALGSLTAWMLEPYAGTRETGMAVDGPEVLAGRLPLVIEAGLTPVIHAIGDAANRAVLDTLEATRSQWQAKALRPRLEHAQHLHPADVSRFAKLGVTASMQPDHLTFDARRIRELLPDRLSRAYAINSLLRSGAHVAFGSDTPVASPDWRRGLLAATRRCGADGRVLNEDECLSVEEALAAHTRGAAYAINREHRSGQLKVGFDADLTVLSHDPTVSTEALEVHGAMLAGRWTKELAW